jgi:phosphohistidine phosphatase SixA
MMRSRWFGTLALAGALLAPALAFADPKIVYVSRHAEKGTEGKDPSLTPQGQARARSLAVILRKVGIKNVFSSTAQRAQQTAQPIAALAGVEVQLYDAGKPAVVVDKIKALPGPTLLVGHSNTVPDLVRMLGGAPGAPIAEDEFDRLYQVSMAADGSVTTVLLTTPTPP